MSVLQLRQPGYCSIHRGEATAGMTLSKQQLVEELAQTRRERDRGREQLKTVREELSVARHAPAELS